MRVVIVKKRSPRPETIFGIIIKPHKRLWNIKKDSFDICTTANYFFLYVESYSDKPVSINRHVFRKQ